MPGVYDYAAINRVQQANDIVDVVGEHVSLKKKGHELIGLCPFHEDHRPSMNVNPVKQIFKCFACGAGGDVLKFVQMREGLTFPQAIERLAERAGIQLNPVRRVAPRTPGEPESVDPNLLARVNKWAMQFFQQSLNDPQKGKIAREYLAGRGITPETIATWRLGLAPSTGEALACAAAQRKIPVQLLQQAGLTTPAGQDKFIHRLMFTITDVTGRVIAFGGRTLDGTGAKYINSPTTSLFDKSNTLFGLEQARHQIVATGTAVVVEGYTDVIIPHQFGCTNVVATLGTSFTAGHGRILRRYTKRVILLFDSDTAGRAAANRALEVCLSQHLDLKLAFVPEGKDPCDFVLAAGKEGFDRVVAQATDVLQFKWDRLRETFAADDTLAGKKAAVEEFLGAIALGFGSNNMPVLESGLMVNRLARMVGLGEAEIRKELARRIKPPSEAGRGSGRLDGVVSTTDWGQGLRAAAQREVLEVLLNEPGLLDRVQPGVSPDLFEVPVLASIAVLLLDVIHSEEDYSLSRVLARAESVEMAERIVELQRIGEEKGNYHARLADALGVLHPRPHRDRGIQTNEAVLTPESGPAPGELRGRQNPHSIGIV
ncbi:MAG: DNA primase [Planctomycetes bacterium]|jgi:DNA primase|nr:DNA primase [Planctomycetota bacterium]